MNTHELFKNLKVLAILISLTFGASYAQAAFVGPPGPAPTCPTGQPGCDAPLNVGAATQVKGSSVGNGAIWSKGSIGTDGGGIFGGSVKVGNTTLPNTKAALDIESTAKGILPPRLTTVQRDAITTGLSAAEKTALDGLTIYNTDASVNGLERFDGTSWGAAVSVTAAAGVDGPAFHVHKNGASQTIDSDGDTGSGSAEQVTWSTEEFDSHNYFASNAFTPQVPGKYLLSATTYITSLGAGQYAGLGIYKNGAPYKWTWLKSSGTDVSVNVTTVVTSNGTTDVFTAWVYYAGTNKVVDGTITSSHFSGSRIGNPATVNQTVNATTIDAPANAVIFFAQTSCPVGWSQYAPASGRYIVGVNTPSNSGLVPSGMTALSDGENRATGQHTHPDAGHVHFLPAVAHYFYDPGHKHQTLTSQTGYSVMNDDFDTSVLGNALGWYDTTSVATPGMSFSNPYYTGGNLGGAYPNGYHNFIYEGNHNSNTGYASIGVPSGSVAGTNAPYVALLACKKN